MASLPFSPMASVSTPPCATAAVNAPLPPPTNGVVRQMTFPAKSVFTIALPDSAMCQTK